ncbi:hypothetical protein MSAN_00282600 [Mycena sanguinolenta]|uniref:Deoxyribonuclease NucA/NucB domain-containing protein n=1 Tax=Mycena sanguinolenta TaxID=230812 RepID=A0A8H7DJY4_9AGAR|nr:hypothetical protein MSAN_00282600 [Mycena sanguinolenta]
MASAIPGLLRPQHRAVVYSRQEEECQYPVLCEGDTWCCPAGSQCCSTVGVCCPTDSNCRADHPGYCCPKSAETCGGKFCTDAGSACCGSYVCKPGFQCNVMGGGKLCCAPSEIHCDNACCPEGSMCASMAGYCSSIGTITQTRTTTSISTSTSTSTTTSTALSTSECTPSATSTPLLDARQRPFPKTCVKMCTGASKDELPVWELTSVPGETDQLIYSMCLGISTRLKNGEILNGLDDGEDILEYNGKGVRNQVVDCTGFCRDLSTASGLGVGSFQCDEYPPASLNPAGGAQTRWCVPRYQNSGTQGPMLANFLNKCGVQPKDKVLVKINGGCSKYNFPRNFKPVYSIFDDVFSPLPVSSTPTHPALNNKEMITAHILQRRATIQLDASNATLRNPNGDSSLTYVAVEIDELADGHYSFEVSFAGGTTIDNVTVMNKYGDEYATVAQPSGSASLSFDISDGSNLPAALIAWTTNPVNVTYSGSGTLTANGTTSSGAVSAAPKGPCFLCFFVLWAVTIGYHY